MNPWPASPNCSLRTVAAGVEGGGAFFRPPPRFLGPWACCAAKRNFRHRLFTSRSWPEDAISHPVARGIAILPNNNIFRHGVGSGIGFSLDSV